MAITLEVGASYDGIPEFPAISTARTLSARRGKFDVSPLVTRPFMPQSVAARGLTKLTFECAIEGGFGLISHFTGDSAIPRGVFSSARAAN
jgi:hypothetical protein